MERIKVALWTSEPDDDWCDMALTTVVKGWANGLLAKANLRLDTLTGERLERARITELLRSGHFKAPFFEPLRYDESFVDHVLKAVGDYRDTFDSFSDSRKNEVGFSFENSYFSSPDAEVYYAIVRSQRPRRVVEVGSGNSTKIVRQAVSDEKSDTTIVSIDPEPRVGVMSLADLHVAARLEDSVDAIGELASGDILFIDSSHEIKPGNDVLTFFFKILPVLPTGVVVHVHDVFLPYEYPHDWLFEKRWPWNEQYLLQAVLQFSRRFDVLWPGFFLQQTVPGFASHFPYSEGRRAQSYWFRVASESV